jgi:hypothetical protein
MNNSRSDNDQDQRDRDNDPKLSHFGLSGPNPPRPRASPLAVVLGDKLSRGAWSQFSRSRDGKPRSKRALRPPVASGSLQLGAGRRSKVVPCRGHRSAPGVLPAFAGVVHDRQSAADYEYRHSKDNQYGGFHCDLATAGPKAYRPPIFGG